MPGTQRVLFISPQPFFEWRGSSIRVKFNIMALEQLGHSVDLLTLPIGENAPEIHSKVLRAWNLFGTKNISIGPSILKIWFDFVMLIQGIGLVLKNRYDVLHGTEEAGFICYLLSFLCRAKCIYEKHSDSKSYKGGILTGMILAIYNQVEKITIKKADLVICTGPGLEEQAREVSADTSIIGIADIPSSLVEPTIQEIKNARNEITDSEDSIIICYVGSFAEYQGVNIIFDSIPNVIDRIDNAQFVIIGGNKDEIAYYKNKLQEKNIVSQVCFLGKIDPDKLPAYLSASDILLAPRKSGVNSPLKLLDYFKAGGAIVATDTIANQRLLDESIATLCPFDANSFSEAIFELAINPEKRKSLGKNTHDLYKSKYNFSEFKAQLGDAYNSL